MDALLNHIAKEWGVIGGAPVTFAILVVLAFGAAYFAASWRFGGTIEHMNAKIGVLEAKIANQPGGANVEARKEKRAAVMRFLAEGERLEGRARSEDTAPVIRDTEAWVERVIEWFNKELDDTYAQLFTSETGLPYVIPIGSMSEDQRDLARWINNRNVRLKECASMLG